MPAIRVIPCLDCRDGRVVKGVRFAGLRDAGDPAELAEAYQTQGADELVLLDVAATVQGRQNQHETVRRVRAKLGIPLTVGGGIRGLDNVTALLDAGADKVSVNTAAVSQPALLTEIARKHGSQCAVLAIDAAQTAPGVWEVLVQSGGKRTGLDVAAWAREATERGIGEILLTSWDRDGTRSGYDLELLAHVRAATTVPVIASGGASSPEDLVDALRAGADAVLAASIFHDGDYTVAAVKQALLAAGLWVRL